MTPFWKLNEVIKWHLKIQYDFMYTATETKGNVWKYIPSVKRIPLACGLSGEFTSYSFNYLVFDINMYSLYIQKKIKTETYILGWK